MKTIILIAIFFTIQINFAQQNLLMELVNIKHHTKNFGLKGKVKQLTVKRGLVDGIGVTINKIYKYNFDKNGKLITETVYKSKRYDNNKNLKKYIYNSDNKLIRINIIKASVLVENNYFHYDKNGNIESMIFDNFKNSDKTTYNITWKNKKPIKYTMINKAANSVYETSNHIFKNKKLVQYDFIEGGELGTAYFEFNKKGLKTKDAYIYKTSSDYNFTTEYTYNHLDDVLTETENDVKTTYDYKNYYKGKDYDKHNNWLKQGYKSLGLYTVIRREMTYY